MVRSKQNTKEVALPKTFVPRVWETVDGRCTIVKEIRRRYETLRQDVGGESVQKDMLCQRAVFMDLCMETMEIEGATTGRLDAGTYTQMSNALLGLLKALGLNRHVKRADDLRNYIEQRTATTKAGGAA